MIRSMARLILPPGVYGQGLRVLRVLAADILSEERREGVLDTIVAAGRA
jgi:hypothetical protein